MTEPLKTGTKFSVTILSIKMSPYMLTTAQFTLVRRKRYVLGIRRAESFLISCCKEIESNTSNENELQVTEGRTLLPPLRSLSNRKTEKRENRLTEKSKTSQTLLKNKNRKRTTCSFIGEDAAVRVVPSNLLFHHNDAAVRVAIRIQKSKWSQKKL